ncbi:hypothetical protein ACIOJD_12860 [Streptomyces sp. NPDC088116]|uniref:hypothetical protein n=1 Tax=Streptomyces sp. NPDC088116 TaxID=3365825 RepID=UPI0037F94D2B
MNGTDSSGATRASEREDAERFIGLSVALTGFDATELAETGMAEIYRATVLREAGTLSYGRLVAALTDAACLSEVLTSEDGELVELARAVCHLWYLGVWPGLPEHGLPGQNMTTRHSSYVVSERSYAEGLVWRCLNTHAPGTGAPGHGSWARPPSGVPTESGAR